ncbi:hypothetical protein B0A48_00708 [Cryoendolithus antarcticus]|uniref:Uncharacterized protein n=1 Tax=Cryoendolithus antarcticus TaxID=1507870 RepID=A0A1V8TV98_9PEZI|nr:hypothetical protein B0A48_00708 [Cryoendolithus antarcticus]
MAKIILTGSHGATPGLRNILTSALTGGAYEGKLDEMLVPQRGAPEPLFVGGGGAGAVGPSTQHRQVLGNVSEAEDSMS